MKIYNKMGRIMYLQLLIRFGAERAMSPKMMGHEDEKSAEAYYDVNLLDVIEDVKIVNLDRFDI